jgi:hypothetical protein
VDEPPPFLCAMTQFLSMIYSLISLTCTAV